MVTALELSVLHPNNTGANSLSFMLTALPPPPQLPVRHLSCSSSLLRKNLAAAGPKKFTAEFIEKQVEEFNVGKRHLANMMGEDPENFCQEDVDVRVPC